MAQQDKLTYEGTFNNSTSGLFKDNTSGDIEAADHRLQVTNTKDSVPFTLDDSYTWPFPQVTASGTDTYTATLSPEITAYVVGQKFQVLFTNQNTTTATLAFNGLAALAITKNGATALSAGDIAAGSIKILAYDGTRLQIVGDGGGTAATTSFTPAGNIAATDVQAAIEELDTEKAPLASPTFTGTPVVPGYQLLVNSATALTDAASMDLTAIKHTLTTSSATRTFTDSYTGDDITLEVTLNTTASVFTFPATALCVSEGIASGDNTCSLNGVSGDKYIIARKKIGSAYYVVCKNFGQ